MSRSLKVLGLLASVSALGLASPAAADECVLDDGTTGGATSIITSTACGPDATANGVSAVAVGDSASASNVNAVAVGHDATASNVSTVAVGYNTDASGLASVAIGASADAAGGSSLAIGERSFATEDAGIALGGRAASIGLGSIAIGDDAKASGDFSVAIGLGSSDDGQAKVVSIGSIGTKRRIINMAAGIADTDGVNVSQLRALVNALGGGASIDPLTGAVAGPSYVLSSGSFNDVGSALLDLDTRLDASAGPQYVAQTGTPGAANTADLTVGANTNGTVLDVANLDGANRTITSVEAASLSATSTEAVNGSQLFATNTNVSQNASDIAALDTRVGTNETNIAANTSSIATNTGNIATNTSSISANSTAITSIDGRVSQNEADIAAVRSGISNANMGLGDVADALGGGSTYDPVTGTLTAPTYNVAGATQNDVGTALAALDDSISNLAASSANAVQYDTDASGARLNSVTLAGGDTSAPVTVSNVAEGELSATSSDAVNGAQLFATNEAVAQNASDIAGNASNIAAIDGRVNQNEAEIASLDGRVGQNETDIASLDGRVTVNRTDIDNLTTGITNGTIGLVQHENGDTEGPIQVAANTGGNVIRVSGTSGSRRITGVGRGTVAASSTDAINGAQFFELQSRVDILDAGLAGANRRIDSLNFDLRELESDLNAGLAGVAALTTIPQSVNPGRWVLGLGSGYRAGEMGVALGASWRSPDDFGTVNIRAAYDSEFTVAAGVGVEF